jgi:hypothetical protein
LFGWCGFFFLLPICVHGCNYRGLLSLCTGNADHKFSNNDLRAVHVAGMSGSNTDSVSLEIGLINSDSKNICLFDDELCLFPPRPSWRIFLILFPWKADTM